MSNSPIVAQSGGEPAHPVRCFLCLTVDASAQPHCDCEREAAELTRAPRVLPDQLAFEAPPSNQGSASEFRLLVLIETNGATLHLSAFVQGGTALGPRCVPPRETRRENALRSSRSRLIYYFKIDECGSVFYFEPATEEQGVRGRRRGFISSVLVKQVGFGESGPV